jgi:hypothetical protein
MELNSRSPSTCNVWDPMDSFDGLFLKEDLDKTDNGLPPSKLKSKLDLPVENMCYQLSLRQMNQLDVRTSQMEFLGHTLHIF